MRDSAIDAGALFSQDNEAVRDVVDSVEGVYGLVLGQPACAGIPAAGA